MPINPQNERIKRQYLTYQREARQVAERTLDGIARALEMFEAHTGGLDFRRFQYTQAISFKASLATGTSERTMATLSASSRQAILQTLKSFFQWLAGQRGYKRIGYAEADYFNLSARETRIARARREPPTPTLEQIRHVIMTMPTTADIERRDRALIAFTLLTGARVGALASFRLKHVDLIEGLVTQDAREVQTKFGKTFTTIFFPVGRDIAAILADWVGYLQTVKLFGYDDPLFPSTRVEVGGADKQFQAQGLARTGWSDGDPIRAIFREAFNRAGLSYYHPHSFRRTLVILGERKCRTPEQFKSWSQNLGHEDVMTTFRSYGTVSRHRQAEIMRELAMP